jgi:NitT/TauT family transport system substrate-binding protein
VNMHNHSFAPRRWVQAAVALLMLITLHGATSRPVLAQPTMQTIKVGVIPIDDGAEVYYAEDMGFFKKAGLNVSIVSLTNGSAIAAAVANGALDIGFSNLVSIATAHAKGVPFTIIAPAALHLATASTAALFVAKDSSYMDAKSLNGMTIAVNGLKNITELATRAWLDVHGGNSSTIKFIEMPMPQMAAAIRQGRVDAAMGSIIYDPTLNTPAATERIIGDTYDGVAARFLVTGYFTTTDWVTKNPDAARKFARAIFESAQWANKNRVASAEIVSRRLNIPLDLVKGVTRSTYAEVLDPKLIQPLIDATARYKLIAQPFPADELVSPVAIRR